MGVTPESANEGDRIESEFMQRAACGDREALGELLQAEGADAIHAVRAGARFASRHVFYSWLKRIAIHNLIDIIRAIDSDKRGGGRVPVSLDAKASSQALLADLIAADGPTPSYQVRAAEAHTLLQSALSDLPNDYRTVVQLYDLDGRSIDEVAAIVGRSPGAVHLLRVRAHRRLRDMLRVHQTVFRELA